MIIPNGTIEARTAAAPAVDPATGYLTAGRATWGDPVPCQWYYNRDNRLGRANGEHFTVAQRVILVEGPPFEAGQVRLRGIGGEVIGEFPVVSIEPLVAVGQTRVTV